jgi:peptidoglycan/LPS O-acetylase OafA/YrhL
MGSAFPPAAARASTPVRPSGAARVDPRLGYLPALDGIRGLAVLAVIVFHGWVVALPGGYVGVDVFFVLSGFLITSLLLRERSTTGSISLPRFYGRRALRLMPPLVPVLIACAMWACLVPAAPQAADTLRGVWATMAYASSWLYANRIALGWLSHTWSLSVEEQFYLVWPLLLAVLLLRGNRRLALAACVLGVGAVLEERTVMFLHGVPWQRMYCGFDTRADALLIGSGLALAADLGLVQRANRWVARAVAVAGIGVLVWAAARATDPGSLAGPGFTGIDLAAAALIAAAAVRPSRLLARLLEARPLTGVGRISYAMYLWHLPMYGFLLGAGVDPPGPLMLLLVLGMTWAAAAFSYELIELPCAELRRRLTRTQPAAVAR